MPPNHCISQWSSIIREAHFNGFEPCLQPTALYKERQYYKHLESMRIKVPMSNTPHIS